MLSVQLLAKNNALPLAVCGDLGLRASTASGINHEWELHQRVPAVSKLVILAVLHSGQLKHNKSVNDHHNGLIMAIKLIISGHIEFS